MEHPTAVEAATKALRTHQWHDELSVHDRHGRDASCAVCRGDVDEMVPVALAAAEDQMLDDLLDAEGELRFGYRLMRRMLLSIQQGWRIAPSAGEWWWVRPALCAADNEAPMALTPDETELWEALRKDRNR